MQIIPDTTPQDVFSLLFVCTALPQCRSDGLLAFHGLLDDANSGGGVRGRANFFCVKVG